jgi:pimeloyl-ACP methyl ester carboxylesterase
MTRTDSHITELPDGRELAWLEVGDPAGAPVLAFHGTPGCRFGATFDEEAVAETGVRLIAPDRPGYGVSTFQPDRRLSHWAADVGRLADHLGLDRFAVFGHSGGGPHAAVCAALLPDRVTAAALVSGVAPLGRPGSEEGMMPFNQMSVRLGRRAPVLLRPVFAVTALARHWPDRALDAMLRQLPPADQAVLSRPEVRAVMERDVRHWGPRTGRAAAQDFELFIAEWGFALEEISVPVHVWQGTADVNVPAAHGRRLAEQIPGAILHECPDEGHFLVADHYGEILRAVTATS